VFGYIQNAAEQLVDVRFVNYWRERIGGERPGDDGDRVLTSPAEGLEHIGDLAVAAVVDRRKRDDRRERRDPGDAVVVAAGSHEPGYLGAMVVETRRRGLGALGARDEVLRRGSDLAEQVGVLRPHGLVHYRNGDV